MAHQQQQPYSSYRTLRLDMGHTVINTDLYPRPETISRDYRVLSWVFSESPQLTVEPGSAEMVDFTAELYSGWYPQESEKELSLHDATLNLPSFIQAQHLETNELALETFFAKYMEHYDSWAETASEADLEAFRGATILKDVMYQHGFIHQTDLFNTHEAYTDIYSREFSDRELPSDVTWETPLLTESEYEMATDYLSDEDIATVEDYVGAVLQLLNWDAETEQSFPDVIS